MAYDEWLDIETVPDGNRILQLKLDNSDGVIKLMDGFYEPELGQWFNDKGNYLPKDYKLIQWKDKPRK